MCARMRISPARSRAWSTAASTIAANPAAAWSASMSTRRCGSRSSTASSTPRSDIGSAIRSIRKPASGRWRAPGAPPQVRAQVRAGDGGRRDGPCPAAALPRRHRRRPLSAPQVLTGVDHAMAVMREETFGPVVGIMKVNGRRRGGAADERQRLRPHRLDLDSRPRRRRAAGAAGRGGDGLRQSLRLSRSLARLDGSEAERPRRLARPTTASRASPGPESLHLRSA